MNKKQIATLINALLNKPTRLYEKFHQRTKLKIVVATETKSIPEAWKKTFYKSYPRLSTLVLPDPDMPPISLTKAFKQRKSERKFGRAPLSLEKLSTLLFYTAGKKDKTSQTRFYPSAGARYPIETYCISLNTELPKGLYHYNLKNNTVELLLSLSTFNVDTYFGQSWMESAACIMVFTAVFERTTIKYGERGYRHVLFDAGAMTQNAYVMSTALHLNICAVGGYKADVLNDLLDIDGLHETVVGVVVCGEKP